MFKLAPSILSADFSCLGQQVAAVEKGGADLIHVDVMDGHFVPNISFGSAVMKSVIKCSSLKFDVHLMIENPDDYIEDFVTDKTEYITVHQEACRHLHRAVQHIKNSGIKAGVSVNPATPVETLTEIAEYADLMLIMSVNPGFGGQRFISSCLKKIEKLKQFREDNGLGFLIEVDGGVNLGNAADIVKAGADILVAGSAVFGSDNIEKQIMLFKSIF